MSIEVFFQEKMNVLKRDSSVLIQFIVKPNSKENRLIGLMLDEKTVMVAIKEPAMEGKANKSLISFISDYFNVPKSMVEIKKGHNSRIKTLLVRT